MILKVFILAILASVATAADHCPIHRDTKCGQNGNRRIEVNVLNLDECKTKCQADRTNGCAFYSYRESDKLCLACKYESDHAAETAFTFYPLDPQLCPPPPPPVPLTPEGNVPFCDAPVAENMKCVYTGNHPDRLYRLTGQSVEQCQEACARHHNCTYYSYQFEQAADEYPKVCMGCKNTTVDHFDADGNKVNGTMEYHHAFHLFSRNCIGRPPPGPRQTTWNGNKCARGTGDPHFMTFDKKKYDCQGDGDYILSRSLDSGFELQARMERVRHKPSVTTHQGVVIKTGLPGEPKVEISYTKECVLTYYIEDTLVDLASNASQTGTDKLAFYPSGNTRTFEYDSGYSLKVMLRSWKGDCLLNVYLCLPETKSDQRYVGILGTPDGEKGNDFTFRNGTDTGLAATCTKKQAHDHCVKTWCVANGESMFKNPTANEHCIVEFDNDLADKVANMEEENPDWFHQCTGDDECLVDAIVADDINEGLRTLMDGEADPEPPTQDELVDATVPEEPRASSDRSGDLGDDTFTTKSPPGAKGDPHFKTHGGEMFDFHGGCDLVLIKNPTYMGGSGLTIHIRTKIETWWSYIETAVLKIGEESFELTGKAQEEEWLWVNGKAVTDVKEGEWNLTTFAGFIFRYKQSLTGKGRTRREAHLHLGHGEKIMFKTYGEFVKVEFENDTENTLKGSLGMLGTYPEGKRVGRDGATIIDDLSMFGQEWQVKPDEPKLFHSYTDEWVVPAGQACAMPVETLEKSKLRKRRLAGGLSEDVVETACAHIKDPSDHKACVFDVIATQDPAMAGAW